MSSIKNIIFDLGGVILNIDYTKTIDAFKNLGIPDFDTLYTQAAQSMLFDEIEKGTISKEKFLSQLQQLIPNDVSLSDVENAWNAMLLDLPHSRLQLLSKLKLKYNIVLLSNTNVIHLAAFHKSIEEKNNITSLNAYFDSVYFSCDMHLRKPDPKIFKLVCKRQKYIPQETLFIDDSFQHIEGAKKAGLRAYHLKNKVISELFDDNLDLIPPVLDTIQ